VNTLPIALVLGKNDKGETAISRFCIGARQLNANLLDTTTECLPNMNEVLKCVSGAYVTSTTDAGKAFWSQRIFPSDRAKCAINVTGPNYVLKTGTSQHNQLMTEITGDDLLWHEESGVALYCDDCVAYTKKRDGESHGSASVSASFANSSDFQKSPLRTRRTPSAQCMAEHNA
jgi:hypothetical protein